jgi:hypothetical protein
VLSTLRDALEMGLKRDLPQTLRVEAGYYFGSLRNAQRALKNDCGVAGARKRLSPSFSRMYRSGDRLAYASARREIPALASAAEAYFGSWALYAAWIDPNLYFVVHHEWRKRDEARLVRWRKQFKSQS